LYPYVAEHQARQVYNQWRLFFFGNNNIMGFVFAYLFPYGAGYLLIHNPQFSQYLKILLMNVNSRWHSNYFVFWAMDILEK
jgi:hypothetical protein